VEIKAKEAKKVRERASVIPQGTEVHAQAKMYKRNVSAHGGAAKDGKRLKVIGTDAQTLKTKSMNLDMKGPGHHQSGMKDPKAQFQA
jgi:hypothetical protein